MKQFFNRFGICLIGLYFGCLNSTVSYGEEPQAEVTGIPVIQAAPVSQNSGLGKLLGKTINMVSSSGSGIFSKPVSRDKGAPEEKPMGLFDPRRSESPVRTARLFKIQINPPVAEPVVTVAEPAN